MLCAAVGVLLLALTQYIAYRQYQIVKADVVWISILGFGFVLTAGLLTFHLITHAAKSQMLQQRQTKQPSTGEKYFRAMIENVTDAIMILDSTEKVLYQNPSTERISGYTLEEIQNLNGVELIHPDDQAKHSAMFASLIQSPCVTLRTAHRFRHKEGHYIWLEGAYANLLTDKLNVIVFNYHDITHLKKAEAETLMALNEKLVTLDRISEGVISLDNEWRYTFINDTALLTHPLGKEGTIGKVYWDVQPRMASPFFKEKFLHAKRENVEVKFEDFSKAYNKWFATKIYPSPDGVTIFYSDVTTEKEAQTKVRESEARLVEAQAMGNIGSWETDMNSLNVVWSLETFKIFELNADTFNPTHTTFLEFVHPDDREKVDHAFKASLIGGQRNILEHRILTNTGKTKWIEERWHISHESAQSRSRAVGTCQDITERKKTEEMIRKSEYELREAQRLAKLGSWNYDLEANTLTWSDELYALEKSSNFTSTFSRLA